MKMRLSLALFSFLSLAASSFGFVPMTVPSLQLSSQRSPLFMSDPGDAPSDTTSDDDNIFTVTATKVMAQVNSTEALVNSMLSQLELTKEISDEKRAEINEKCLELEKMNPTPNPTMSPLLNGVWEVSLNGCGSAKC